jgi:hypothetical protein
MHIIIYPPHFHSLRTQLIMKYFWKDGTECKDMVVETSCTLNAYASSAARKFLYRTAHSEQVYTSLPACAAARRMLGEMYVGGDEKSYRVVAIVQRGRSFQALAKGAGSNVFIPLYRDVKHARRNLKNTKYTRVVRKAQPVSPKNSSPVASPAPAEAPSAPAEAPSAPDVAPSAPDVAPSASDVAPSASDVAPSAPVVAPSAPVVAPSAPVVAPSAPAPAPSAPVVVLSPSVTKKRKRSDMDSTTIQRWKRLTWKRIEDQFEVMDILMPDASSELNNEMNHLKNLIFSLDR